MNVLSSPSVVAAHMHDPVRKSCARESGSTSYLEWDRKGPALHFAHANGFNAETYRALLSPLADRLHVFASDARGHGFTTLPVAHGPPREWTIYRDDLEAFLARVHSGPIVLAGHSMGAIASMMFAARHPGRVRALILVEPVLVPARLRWTRIAARLSARVQGNGKADLAERAAKRRATFPSFDAALAAYRGRGAFKTWPDGMLHDYLAGGLVLTGNGTEMRLACTPAWESASFRSTPPGAARLARRVRCPIVLLHGENGTAREAEIATIARARPDSRIVHVPGTTHFLPMERPELVREEILRAVAAVA